jgi:hypothetical protein
MLATSINAVENGRLAQASIFIELLAGHLPKRQVTGLD